MAATPPLEVFDSAHPAVRAGLKVLSGQPVRGSMMTAFAACERFGFWRYRLGLVRRRTVQKALMIGTLVHEGMRLAGSGLLPNQVRRAIEQRVKEELQRLESEGLGVFVEKEVAEVTAAGQLAQAMVLAFAAELARCVEADRTGRESGFLPLRATILSTETLIRAAVPVPAGPSWLRKMFQRQPIEVMGRIDVLLKNADGTVRVGEYKTISGSSSVTARALALGLEPKTHMYRLLAPLVSEDRPVVGVVGFLLKKPTIRLRRGETMDEYIERVTLWYREKAASQPNDPPISIAKFQFDGPLPDGFLKQLATTAALLRIPPDARRFAMTGAPHQCIGLGRSPCPYLTLCASDPATWTTTILADFVQDLRDEGDVGDGAGEDADEGGTT